MTPELAPFCQLDQHPDCSGCSCPCHQPPEPLVPPNHDFE